MEVPFDTNCSSRTTGRPIPYYSVYVVNSELRPVATGVQGEIYIGGPGVGRGYVRKPKLMAERFV